MASQRFFLQPNFRPYPNYPSHYSVKSHKTIVSINIYHICLKSNQSLWYFFSISTITNSSPHHEQWTIFAISNSLKITKKIMLAPKFFRSSWYIVLSRHAIRTTHQDTSKNHANSRMIFRTIKIPIYILFTHTLPCSINPRGWREKTNDECDVSDSRQVDGLSAL